jgi:hypothetical protein
MKSVLIFCLALSLSLSASAQESLSSFNRITVNGSVILTLKKGDKPQYTATGDTDKLKVKIDDGKLKISRLDVTDGWKNRAYVTVWYTDIRSLYASAGAQISHEGTMNVGDFELSTDTGASGDLVIDAQSLEVSVGEGGVLRLEGSTRVLEARASTGAILKARDLVAHRVYVSANTGASATVHAKDEIDANATLGGAISYEGSPEVVRVKETLGGSVRS